MTRTARLPVIVTAGVAAFWLGIGAWAFLHPRSFYDTIATFPPYNEHFLHDAGAFQVGVGAVLALALWMRNRLQAILLGVGVGSVLHVLAHVIDRDLGGRSTDWVGLAVLAAVTLAAAAAVPGEEPAR